jgi:hypothetical protein
MAFRSRKAREEEAYAAAKAAVTNFWGVGHNTPDAFSALERALTDYGLSASHLDRLRMELPPIDRATVTGGKVLRVDSLLKRLYAAAGGG